ncbi:InlB B-repeat-containing protein [Hominenteromicrobium sp.]|uniref:InlB B-repeat-containing protein n=1 Tax=Hominenteromicrobium sp. TaxID=3073581 RepID=UPI00399A7156
MPGYTPNETVLMYPQGFAFAGWYDNELCVGDGVSMFTGKTMPAQSITLYAKWRGADS